MSHEAIIIEYQYVVPIRLKGEPVDIYTSQDVVFLKKLCICCWVTLKRIQFKQRNTTHFLNRAF